ncbi:DUF4328 domain-containing protein [Nocardioides luteus]|uniref:DUF4328 domain-containing protein n=1 Tax=Nocardioides luteus TaxID=1844 RepID=A0A1J4N1F6_9ACTN|nr:DUF4328 domain-containing protein [Nocardioides luteus]OIJ25362.1 hypothetical protein UG56_018290 [Nocardioides luteus]
MSNPYGAPPPFPDQPLPDVYQQQAPGTPQQPAPQLPATPRTLATAAIWLAVALTVAEVATAVVSYPSGQASNDVATSSVIDDSTMLWLIGGMILSLGTTIVMIPVYVIGCLWLQRSYELALALRPTYRMGRSVVWVWLGWWVPIVSLWFPLQVVDDVRTATARDEPRPSLAMWWLAWLVALVAGQISARVFASEEVLSHDALVIVAMLDALVAVAMVFGCIKWISIIRGITRDQDAARG